MELRLLKIAAEVYQQLDHLTDGGGEQMAVLNLLNTLVQTRLFRDSQGIQGEVVKNERG